MAGRQKLAIIVHCWGGSPDATWYPWLKGQLEERGYDVVVPAMPNPEEPIIDAWVNTLQALIADNPAEELLLIGHSIGCQTIVRTLAASDVSAKVVFVAGWVRLSGLGEEDQAIAEPWLTGSIDTTAAKTHIISSVAVFSEDDPLVPLSNQDFFRDQLGSQIVTLKGYGHFDADADTREIPELLSYI